MRLKELNCACKRIYNNLETIIMNSNKCIDLQLMEIPIDFEDEIEELVLTEAEKYIYDNDYNDNILIQTKNEILDELFNKFNFDNIKSNKILKALENKNFKENYLFDLQVDNFEKA